MTKREIELIHVTHQQKLELAAISLNQDKWNAYARNTGGAGMPFF